MEELEELVKKLCSAYGAAGSERLAADAAAEELSKYARVRRDALGSVIGEMGDENAERHILLDAHLDQIGLIVTAVDEKGFLKIANCGGADQRVLPGTQVTVLGRRNLSGVVCCMPPHLVKSGEEKVPPASEMAVDIGLDHEEAENAVAPGDRIVFAAHPRMLVNGRITSPGLDNRASVAALLMAARMLSEKALNAHITILFSVQEETGGSGAHAAAFGIDPKEALVVDVSFASQPDVPAEKTGQMSCGPMIGVAPSLSDCVSGELIRLAKEDGIPSQLEIMNGKTGTNADEVSVTRAGVKTGILSIPLRYMHTPAECVDLADIENTARLVCAYATKGDVSRG